MCWCGQKMVMLQCNQPLDRYFPSSRITIHVSCRVSQKLVQERDRESKPAQMQRVARPHAGLQSCGSPLHSNVTRSVCWSSWRMCQLSEPVQADGSNPRTVKSASRKASTYTGHPPQHTETLADTRT